MSMKALDELRDKFCEELDEIARKPEMSAGDLETVHKLTDTIKNIDKIVIMDETGEYSQAGDWEARGRFGDYHDGSSYRGGQRRDNMGRYSRDGGMYDDGVTMRRGGMGRRGYSRGGDMMEHVEKLEDMAETPEQKEAVRRFKKQLEDIM